MSRRLSAAVATVGALLLTAGVLSACATASPGASPAPTEDPTAGPVVPIETEFDLAWLDGGRAIGIVTTGSSTCIPFADGATLTSAGVLEVTIAEPAEQACTRDLVPRATVVALPEDVDPTQELEVVLAGDYLGDESIDGLEGTIPDTAEYAPSAGWAGSDVVVLLSWGSSSCAPLVENIEVTAPNEATVTFVDPPADQVCTADMAPRGTIIELGIDDDAVEDTLSQLVLMGGEFDAVTVPLLGDN